MSEDPQLFPEDPQPEGGRAVLSKKAPGAKKASGSKKAPPKRQAPGRKAGPTIADSVAFLYQMGGQVVTQRGSVVVGPALVQNAQPCGKAWEDFLSQWPAVTEWMERFSVGPATVQLIMVHLPIVTAVRQEAELRAAAVNGEGPGGYQPGA